MSRPTIVRLLPVLDFGGVESRVGLQARMAKDRGYDLRVCTFTRAGAAADVIRAEGVPVDVLDIPASTKSVRATGRLIQYIRRIRPSLVHSSIVEANVQLCLAAAVTRVPAIVEEVGQPSHSPRARAAFRLLYRVPRQIVAVSKVTARYLTDIDRAPANRVRLIYNCAHPDFFGEDRASVSRPASDTTRFVAIGRLHPIKNQEPLIRGFAKLLESGAKATLQIVGDGPLKTDLLSVASAL
ncbi:MAG: glycosyltransferase involved in cell wall biosynthesis, partial [Myxococcota bacterium]